MEPIIDNDWTNCKNDPVDEPDGIPNVTKSWVSREKGVDPPGGPSNKTVLENAAEDILVQKRLQSRRCDLPGYPRSTFLMVFSPDGTKVASTHGNHNVYVSELASGKHVCILRGHPRTPWCISFHPSHPQLIGSGCLGGQVRVWDLSGGSETWTVETETVISSLAFHPRDQLLVIATFSELYFWNWSQPAPHTRVSTNNFNEKVKYVAFDALGFKLITGIINVWTNSDQEGINQGIPQQAGNNNGAEGPGQFHIIPQSTRRMLADQQYESYTHLVRRYDSLVRNYHRLFMARQDFAHRAPRMARLSWHSVEETDRGTDPMETDGPIEVDWSIISGPNNSGTSNNHSTSSNASTSNTAAGADTASISGTSSISGTNSNSGITNDISTSNNSNTGNNSARNNRSSSTNNDGRVNPGPFNRRRISLRQIVADHDRRSVNGTANVSNMWVPLPRSSSGVTATSRVDPAPPTTSAPLHSSNSSSASSSSSTDSNTSTASTTSPRDRIPFGSRTSAFRPLGEYEQRIYIATPDMDPEDPTQPRVRLMRSHPNAPRRRIFMPPQQLFFSGRGALTPGATRPPPTSASSTTTTTSSAAADTARRPPSPRTTSSPGTNPADDTQMINESLDLIRDILRDSGARLLNLVTNMSLVTLANAEVGRVAINDAAHIPSLSTHRGVNRTAVFTAAGPTSLEDSMFGPLQPPSNGQTGTSNSHPGVFSTTGAAIDLTSRTSTSPSSASTTSSSRLGTDFVPAAASTLPELFASFGSPTAPRLTRIGAYRSPGAPHDDAAARPVLFTASGPMPLSAPGPSTHMDETYPATLPSQTVHAARLTPYVNTRTSHVFGSGLFTASAPVPFTAPESAIRSVPSAMPSTSTDSSSFTVSGPFSASGPTPFGSWNGPPNSTTTEPIPVPQSEPRRQSNRLVFNLNPTPEERRLNSALYRRTTEGGMRNFLSKLYRHRFRVRNQNEAAPGASPSDTAPPDTAPPDTAPPDTAPPDTAPPDTAPPDTAPPVTAPPDTAPPDTAPPDTALLDTAPPDTAPPDTAPPDTAPFDLNDDSDSADEDITRTAADRPARLLSSREAFAKVETGVRALIRHSYMLSLMLSRGRRATYPELLKMWEDLRRHVLALDIQSRPANLSSAQYARTVMDRFRLISEVSRGITSQLEAGRPRPDEADVANRHAALFPSRAYDEILAGPSGVVPIRDPSSRRVTRASARALLLANTNTDAPATTEANSSAAARTRSRPRAASESRLAPHMTSRMRYYMMRKRLSANVRRRLDEDAHRRTGRPVTPLRQPRRRPGTTLDPNMPRAEIRVRAMQVLSVLFYMMMDCLEERDLSRIIIQMLKTIKRALRITCILLSNNPNREGRPTENESVVTEASSLSTTPADPGASTSAASGASASAVPTASTLDVPVASTSTVPAASTSDIPAEVPMDADCGSSSSSLSSDERNPPENFDPTALVNETATAALTPHRWSNRLAVQISAANRNYSSTARRRRDLYLEIRREKALHKCNPSANPIRKKKAQPPTASSRIPLLRRSSSARNLVMRSRPPTSDPGTSNVPSYATPPRPSTSQDNAPPPPSGATGGIEGRQAYRNRVELYRIAQLNAIRVRNAARERIRRLHTLRLYTSALREIDSIDEDVSEDLDGLDEVIDPEVQLIGVRGVDTLSRRAANAVRRDTDREVQRVAGESELGPAPGTDRDASRAGERNAGRTGDQPAGERGLRSGIIMARADQIESVINQIAVPIVQVNDLPVGDNQPPVVARVQPIILAQNAIVLEDGLANMHGLLDAGLMPETLPTHRVQAWDFTSGNPPDISDRTKNMIVQRCRIHNDASIDISKDGRLLVALLPMPRLRSSMHRLGVYSLEWDRLGQCLHTAALEQSAVSVALSPTSRYLAVGLGSRRFTYLPNTRNNVFALLYKLSPLDNTSRTGLTPIKELNQNWEQQFTSLNCLRWAPQPGQGLVYANNTGQLIIMS